ncbi:hypothetical protein VKT23_008226 [Stygiomarasmius scandens]|uniref:F-box domain-containing protein n=1 Tax=Marasmiellus scandens TaxID=2682957 RepID=A0ABR1JNT3_9AGAR
MFPFPSGSKNPFLSRPPSPECSDSETKSVVQKVDFSSTILCTNCLHTFPAPDQTTAPYTSEKLRAKHVPFDAEIAGIQTCINDLTNNLSGYYVEIKRVEEILTKLSRQRDCLERYREEYLTLLSPIRRLPAEILSKIFQYHCQTPMFLQGARISHRISGLFKQEEGITQAPALYLSHVCSFWRELSFSIPSLWASLDIDIDIFNPLSYGQRRILHTFLDNSCSSPLTVKLKVGLDYSTEFVFGVLVQHSHRWQTATWEPSGGYYSIDPPSQDLSLDLSLLTSLSMKNCSLSNLQAIFRESKALQHLTLENVNFDSILGFMLSCKQVKTVVAKRQSIKHTLIVLANCPELQSVEISQDHSTWYTPPFNQSSGPEEVLTIDLGKLTFLTIFADNLDFERLFDIMTAPILTSLSLSSLMSGTFPIRAFLGFLSRTSGILKELRLDSIKIGESYLLEVLQHTPKVRHLGIRDTSHMPRPWTPHDGSPLLSPTLSNLPMISNSLLRALTVTPPHLLPFPGQLSSIVLPELHTIDFVLQFQSVDYGVLTDMVASRSKPNLDIGLVSPLRNVSVRQGTMWMTDPHLPEPSAHFMRPLVALEPVILDDQANEGNGPNIMDYTDMGIPDPDLMNADEIAYQKVERTDRARKNINLDAQGPGENSRMERVKDRVWKCIWWGGSLVTPEFSFVRLVSGVL